MGSALAAQTSYRLASAGLSHMVKVAISPSSIQCMVWGRGGHIARQEAVFRSEQAGKVAAEVLYAESDGAWIHLQHEQLKRLEVRGAVMYTGKKGGKRALGAGKQGGDEPNGGNNLNWQVKLREWADYSYDLEHTEMLVVEENDNRWVRQSFELFHLPQAHVLDCYHVKRTLRQADGQVLDVPPPSSQLFSAGFEIE